MTVVVADWRRGVLPGFRCPSCGTQWLALVQSWGISEKGVTACYNWLCRRPGCAFITTDKPGA